jgi:hypothetical protein
VKTETSREMAHGEILNAEKWAISREISFERPSTTIMGGAEKRMV